MPKDWIREYIYLALHPWKQWQAGRLEAQFRARLEGVSVNFDPPGSALGRLAADAVGSTPPSFLVGG